MDAFLQFLTTLLEADGVGISIVYILVLIATSIGSIALTVYGLSFIRKNFTSGSTIHQSSTKDDIQQLKHLFEREIGRIEASINNIEVEIEALRQTRNEDRQALIPLQKDIEAFTSDSKSQYLEITRQFQGIQRDLASLHGTILGLETTRSQLK